MRKSKNLSLFLDSVNAGVVGLMAYALYPLGKVAFLDPIGIIVFLLTLLLLWRFPKISSFKLVSFGIIFGLLLATFLVE